MSETEKGNFLKSLINLIRKLWRLLKERLRPSVIDPNNASARQHVTQAPLTKAEKSDAEH